MKLVLIVLLSSVLLAYSVGSFNKIEIPQTNIVQNHNEVIDSITCHKYLEKLFKIDLVNTSGVYDDSSNTSVYYSSTYDYKMLFFHISIPMLFLLFYYVYMNNKLKKEIQLRIEAENKLNHLVNIDPLTNLFNRRYLKSIENKFIHANQRQSDVISLFVLDIDHFKKINDTYGHDIGDKTLKILAAKMLELTRPTDIIVRLGGEEFLIILPETNLSGAQIVAEKIRMGCHDMHIQIDEKESLSIAVSLGVTTVDFSIDQSLDDAINRADKALYEAKSSGRDRSITIEP